MTGREEDGNRRWLSAAKEQSVRSAQNGIAAGRTPEGITRSFTIKYNYILKRFANGDTGKKQTNRR